MADAADNQHPAKRQTGASRVDRRPLLRNVEQLRKPVSDFGVIKGFGTLVPLENENRWTDLLAVLLANDAGAVAGVLGLGFAADRHVTVAREVRAGPHERVDLQIHVDGQLHTVLEAKVLSGLGHTQLARYDTAYPGAQEYVLVYPARLVIDPGTRTQWRGVSWEQLLGAFATSPNSWVADTAVAWLRQLDGALPQVGGDTQWNDLEDGDPISLVMRARLSWVYSKLRPPPPLVADFMASGGSKAWVARLQMPAPVPGYVIAAEIEDTSARGWPSRYEVDQANPIAGPRLWVGLRQHEVKGSEGFDWGYLAALWPHMQAARDDWLTTRPGLPAAHDRLAWKQIGSPPGLGYGFGHREAAKSGTCMFGSRVALRADSTLQEVVEELDSIAQLLLGLAQVQPAAWA